jgi:hypothetical protein
MQLQDEPQIAAYYAASTEKKRQVILSGLPVNERVRAFEYGLTRSWHLLPPRARNLVAVEFHHERVRDLQGEP